jgi:hypothetical protein
MSVNTLRNYLAKHKASTPFYPSASQLAKEHDIDHKGASRILREAGYELMPDNKGWALPDFQPPTPNTYNGLTLLVPQDLVDMVNRMPVDELLPLVTMFLRHGQLTRAACWLLALSYVQTAPNHHIIVESGTPDANIESPLKLEATFTYELQAIDSNNESA